MLISFLRLFQSPVLGMACCCWIECENQTTQWDCLFQLAIQKPPSCRNLKEYWNVWPIIPRVSRLTYSCMLQIPFDSYTICYDRCRSNGGSGHGRIVVSHLWNIMYWPWGDDPPLERLLRKCRGKDTNPFFPRKAFGTECTRHACNLIVRRGRFIPAHSGRAISKPRQYNQGARPQVSNCPYEQQRNTVGIELAVSYWKKGSRIERIGASNYWSPDILVILLHNLTFEIYKFSIQCLTPK